MSPRASAEASAGGGVFLPLLTVLFIGLKLTGHIDWSWWWVLAPLWAPAALGVVFLACWGVVLALAGRGSRRDARARRALRDYGDRFGGRR